MGRLAGLLENLSYHGKQKAGQDARILSDNFKLSPTQAATVLSVGQAFLSEIRKLDEYTRDEIKKRYRHVPAQTGPPAAGTIGGRPATPQKTARERAMADGLYQEIEGRKQAAVAQHLQALRLNLGAMTAGKIQTFVQTSVVSHIKPMQPQGPGQSGASSPMSPAERMK